MDSLLEKFIKRHGRLPTEVDPDYLEMLKMDKVRVVAVPLSSPGKCANCGTAKQDGRNYVDIGLQIDWYGAVFFCGYCINEIARKIGLFNKLEDDIRYLQNQLDKLTALNYNGKELQDTILKTFNEVKEHYEQLHSTGNNSTTDSAPSVESEAGESGKSGISEAESGITESPTVPRRSYIPSLADLIQNG